MVAVHAERASARAGTSSRSVRTSRSRTGPLGWLLADASSGVRSIEACGLGLSTRERPHAVGLSGGERLSDSPVDGRSLDGIFVALA